MSPTKEKAIDIYREEYRERMFSSTGVWEFIKETERN
jgi:hypothetical protein